MEAPKTRILIIEDNADDEELLMHQLRKAGLHQHIRVIDDGRAALAYLTSEDSRCDELIAIFLDLKLPGVSGLQVLEEVRARDRTKNLSVIVMTSSNSPEDLEKCRHHGVSCYIQKPITFANFTKAVADSFHAPVTRSGPMPARSTGTE
jgi:CheY-like chemotaxis protein